MSVYEIPDRPPRDFLNKPINPQLKSILALLVTLICRTLCNYRRSRYKAQALSSIMALLSIQFVPYICPSFKRFKSYLMLVGLVSRASSNGIIVKIEKQFILHFFDRICVILFIQEAMMRLMYGMNTRYELDSLSVWCFINFRICKLLIYRKEDIQAIIERTLYLYRSGERLVQKWYCVGYLKEFGT